jgi:hypothetical protein
MNEIPKIVGVVLEQGDEEVTWRSGDKVIINNPEHADHGKTGVIVTFQIIKAEIPDSSDEGVIYPIVCVDTPATLFVIPFTRLIHTRVDG